MGAQFHDQCVPHWKTVTKRNVMVQAIRKTIMIQQAIMKGRERLKIDFQRKTSDSFINPKAIFSVVWNAYLYFWARISRSVVTGQLFTTGEWPVIAPCIVPPRKMPFSASTKTFTQLAKAREQKRTTWTDAHQRRECQPVICAKSDSFQDLGVKPQDNSQYRQD
jgi:hypothetical protein